MRSVASLSSGPGTATDELTAAASGDLARRLKEQAVNFGFDAAGITHVRPSEHAAFYEQWLAAQYHGDMAYLARADAVQHRLDPNAAWPALRSALVVALRYDATAADTRNDPARGIIARYAHGPDYHRVLKNKLLRLLHWLEADVGRPLPAARAYVDSGPVLERELARRAGLGWFGRNTMLIHPRRGSYFFLGSLLLDIELPADQSFERDHCGTCNACVEACPTGALLGRDDTGAPVMDARRCISYLTIENRGPIPRELRPLIGNRIFGCDICQEVCPWNSKQRILSREGAEEQKERQQEEGHQLIELMGMSQADWDEYSRGKAVRRAGRAGFRRNVAVALGNWGDEAAVAPLASALSDADPLVRSHAAWGLGRIGSSASTEVLAERLSDETDQGVIDEIRSALASKW
jgi:epoxyqueuosine reductase